MRRRGLGFRVSSLRSRVLARAAYTPRSQARSHFQVTRNVESAFLGLGFPTVEVDCPSFVEGWWQRFRV